MTEHVQFDYGPKARHISWEPYIELISQLLAQMNWAAAYPIRFLFVRAEDLMRPQLYSREVQTITRSLHACSDQQVPADQLPCPTIVIGPWDLRAGISAVSKANLGTERRVGFWDSSIWYRYVPLGSNFPEELAEIIKECQRYWDLELYRSVVALEYLEFNLRLLEENHLVPFWKQEGHNEGVIPFQYTSERIMGLEADQWAERIHACLSPPGKTTQIQWKAYLLDDYYQIPIRIYNGGTEVGIAPDKASLIETLLVYNSPNGSLTIELDGDSSTEKDSPPKPHIPSLLARIEQGEIFDLILLDYYLGKVEDQDSYRSELGYEFLDAISLNAATYRPLAEPQGKLWIFPISSFPHAFKSHVSARGGEHFMDFWYMSDGGNPVNCPQQFRLKVYKLLWLQIQWLQQIIPDQPDLPRPAYGDFFPFVFQYLHQRLPDSVQVSPKAVEINLWAQELLTLFTSTDQLIQNLFSIANRQAGGITHQILETYAGLFESLTGFVGLLRKLLQYPHFPWQDLQKLALALRSGYEKRLSIILPSGEETAARLQAWDQTIGRIVYALQVFRGGGQADS